MPRNKEFTWSTLPNTRDYGLSWTWTVLGIVALSSTETTGFHILWGVQKENRVTGGTQDIPGLRWWAQQDAKPVCHIVPGKYSYQYFFRDVPRPGSKSTAKLGTADGKYRIEATIKRVHFLGSVSFDLDIDIWVVYPREPGQEATSVTEDD